MYALFHNGRQISHKYLLCHINSLWMFAIECGAVEFDVKSPSLREGYTIEEIKDGE